MVLQGDVRTKQTTASTIQKLTDEAIAKIGAKHTITLQDGTTRQITETGYVTAEGGGFQLYIIPAQQRTRRTREHLRVTFSTMESGRWKRCSKDAFVAKMDAVVQVAAACDQSPAPAPGSSSFY
jgi:hypothetical protein